MKKGRHGSPFGASRRPAWVEFLSWSRVLRVILKTIPDPGRSGRVAARLTRVGGGYYPGTDPGWGCACRGAILGRLPGFVLAPVFGPEDNPCVELVLDGGWSVEPSLLPRERGGSSFGPSF